MERGERVANRYIVRELLGKGGLASVYRVHDLVFGSDVALKLVGAEEEEAHLRSEHLALRGGQHPSLPRVYDFGFAKRRAFYTSTLVPGRPLEEWARGMAFADLARPLGDVLSALASLHRRSVAHGDVHPKNVLVDDGRAFLLDLSCARPFGVHQEVSGTPGFLAPEALRGEVARTTDLYALGISLSALASSLKGGLPRAAREIAARLSSPDPRERPQSAEEVSELLDLPWAPPRASDSLGCALVGRAKELLALREARERGPSVVVVRGDEGSGLTRLLEEAKAEAQLAQDALLVSGARPNAIPNLLSIALGEGTDVAGPSATLRAVERLSSRAERIALFIDDVHELLPSDRAQLDVLLRSVPRSGSLFVALASRVPIADLPEVTLAALSEADVKRWLEEEIPKASLDAIVRTTGGYPKEIASVVAQADAWDSRSLDRALAHAASVRGAFDIGALGEDAKVVLATIVAGGVIDAALLSGEEELLRSGLVMREPNGLRLGRPSDGPRIAAALGRRCMTQAHEALAQKLDPSRPEELPAWIRHVAFLDLRKALGALGLAPAAIPASALRPAVDVVLEELAHASNVPDELLRAALVRAAEVSLESGEPGRSLSLVARARRHGGPKSLLRIAGAAYAQMGDSRRAVVVLRRLLPSVRRSPEYGPVAAALSLALLKRGADADALAVARAALEAPDLDRGTIVDLTINAAFATSRRGATEEARTFLARARHASAEGAPARARHRLASATGFIEYGAGDTTAAAIAYKEALEIAEEHGLDDIIAPAALNYGSACHEQGDLGRAEAAYRRGERIATALGMPTTEVTLAFDLAKVYADIGSYDRAIHHAERARTRARAEKMPLLEAGACAILAEAKGALELYAEAEALAVSAGERDRLALAVQRAKSHLLAEDARAAERVLLPFTNAARALGRDSEASFLGARAAIAIAQGQGSAAIDDLERALPLAEASGQRGLVAEIEALLADAYALAGTPFAADRHRLRARELWEKVLALLPADLHVAFRTHPARKRVFSSAQSSSPTTDVAPRAAVDLRRILEINRRLNSATTTTAVLEETMDAAISITNAERGFLLVHTRGKKDETSESLRVAVARNFDRENLRQGHLKFSRTVAERVVKNGEPVIAVDAEVDPRFTKARSVHAMRLKSVLCVPIRSPDGILGAIYVDHRLSERGFATDLIELLFALADQAALALVRARLVEELKKKTAELEERNRDVEQLARGQALEIARLKRTIAEESEPQRFEYGGLIATSAPMKRVLGVLDRVIQADVTVLVRGESGTGKERVARAVHANSGRKNGPFVAINCGALPEALLEAELFGYRKGAFTGATRDKEGLFVAARGGTLFLDELGEMPPSMQVKLLRVLQEREVLPLGENAAIPTDVRLVCATNRVLKEEVEAGRFREDLYYRVAVVEVELPPLRDRIEDVLPISEAILDRLATEHARPRATLGRDAERALLAHPWPGNVRELENVLTKGFLLSRGQVLDAADLELATTKASSRGPGAALRARITATLDETDWNVVLASRLLGIPRATLYRKMRRFGLARPSTS